MSRQMLPVVLMFRVVDAGDKVDLWRLERVVCGEIDLEKKDASGVWGIGLSWSAAVCYPSMRSPTGPIMVACHLNYRPSESLVGSRVMPRTMSLSDGPAEHEDGGSLFGISKAHDDGVVAARPRSAPRRGPLRATDAQQSRSQTAHADSHGKMQHSHSQILVLLGNSLQSHCCEALLRCVGEMVIGICGDSGVRSAKVDSGRSGRPEDRLTRLWYPKMGDLRLVYKFQISRRRFWVFCRKDGDKGWKKAAGKSAGSPGEWRS